MHHPERQRRLHRQRRRHCVRGELKRLRARAKTVAHCTEKLQACVGLIPKLAINYRVVRNKRVKIKARLLLQSSDDRSLGRKPQLRREKN